MIDLIDENKHLLSISFVQSTIEDGRKRRGKGKDGDVATFGNGIR